MRSQGVSVTDSKLRELERRWKESGSVEDEAAYLLERVRVGDLATEKLELAAYCGHEGARLALGEQAPAMGPPIDPRVRARPQAWMTGLSAFGTGPARAVVAWCCVRVLEESKTGHAGCADWRDALIQRRFSERLPPLPRIRELGPLESCVSSFEEYADVEPVLSNYGAAMALDAVLIDGYFALDSWETLKTSISAWALRL